MVIMDSRCEAAVIQKQLASAIYRRDTKATAQLLRQALFTPAKVKDMGAVREETEKETLSRVAGFDLGHTTDVHSAQSDAQLIGRLRITEHDKTDDDKVSFSSSFIDDAAAMDMVTFCIYNNAEKVAGYLTGNFQGVLELSMNLDEEDEPVGRGFDQKFREIETNATRIVLKKDLTRASHLGVKTAYPDITPEHGRFTGIAYDHSQIADLDNVIFESCLEETAFRLNNKLPDMQIRYRLDQDLDVENIRLSYQDPEASDNSTVNIFITENDMKIKQKICDKPTRQLTINDIPPDKRRIVNDIRQFLMQAMQQDAPPTVDQWAKFEEKITGKVPVSQIRPIQQGHMR